MIYVEDVRCRGLGEVIKFRVYNARVNQQGGDRPERAPDRKSQGRRARRAPLWDPLCSLVYSLYICRYI